MEMQQNKLLHACLYFYVYLCSYGCRYHSKTHRYQSQKCCHKTLDNKNTATLQVAFDVHNPNANTMILDGIHYNLYVKNVLITSGDIGTEAPEDVIRSQNGFPVIANSTVTLKDTQAIHRNNMNTITWDNIAEGKTNYVINGTYSYRQTAGLQASGGANQFSLTFP